MHMTRATPSSSSIRWSPRTRSRSSPQVVRSRSCSPAARTAGAARSSSSASARRYTRLIASVGELGPAAVPYELGEDLPGDVEPQVGGYPDEATLWLREHAALVVGDVFLAGERGFRVQPDSWLAEGLTHDDLRERLRPLVELPVEILLPTHGHPILENAHETLESALDS